MEKAWRRQSVGSYNADNAINPFWNLPKNSLNTLYPPLLNRSKKDCTQFNCILSNLCDKVAMCNCLRK